MEYIDRIDGETVCLSIAKIELKKLPTYRTDDVLVGAVLQALWEDTIFRRTEYRQIHVEVEHGIAGEHDLVAGTHGRSVYILDVGLFAVGSVLVATAPSFAVLLLGRAIQGLGSGGIFPVASAVIGDTFPAGR